MASRLLLSVFVLFLATQINADGSLRVGEFTKDSKLLYHGNFDAVGFIFLKRTETFDIKLTNGGKIKAIDIQDLRGDSSSWILAGGVGEDFATIKLESKRSSGYNFIIDVYGYDDDEYVEDQPSEGNGGKDNEENTENEDNNQENEEKEDKDEVESEKNPENEAPKESFEQEKQEEQPEEANAEEAETNA